MVVLVELFGGEGVAQVAHQVGVLRVVEAVRFEQSLALQQPLDVRKAFVGGRDAAFLFVKGIIGSFIG